MGSWDNFKTAYRMHRDSRIGPEHWSGCHRFSDIICDGKTLSDGSRDGALKMGGTYWYYYKLDDEIEFHNSVEPSTTQCPLLPGQLVNELNVPMVLSGNRARNDSVSSTSSERCTMNPSDKFINPRPVPKPQLSRLKTSPTLERSSWGVASTPGSSRSGRLGTSATVVSEPGSANTVRRMRAAKISLDPVSRSSSRANSPGSAISNGLKSAFRSFRVPRSASPDSAAGDASSLLERNLERLNKTEPDAYDVRKPRSGYSSRDPSPSPLDQELVFRKLAKSPDGSVEAIIPSSFQKHRRQRSTSREPSSLRNSLTLEESETQVREGVFPSRQPLSALKEVASAQNTPGLMTGSLLTADLEKRLPTLPNSPSSAYPPSNDDGDRSHRGSLDIDQLQSHFSSTTIDTDSAASSPDAESTRFSGWTQGSMTARSSIYAHSLIDDEPMSALLGDGMQTPRRQRESPTGEVTDFEDTPQQPWPRRDASMPSVKSSSTVSSTTVSSLSTSPSEYAPGDDDWRIVSGKPRTENPYQRYQLPLDDHGSETTLKQPNDSSVVASRLPGQGLKEHTLPATQTAYHSSNMQHLLDELSYLGDMIHHQ
jgi:hypothetical protein